MTEKMRDLKRLRCGVGFRPKKMFKLEIFLSNFGVISLQELRESGDSRIYVYFFPEDLAKFEKGWTENFPLYCFVDKEKLKKAGVLYQKSFKTFQEEKGIHS